MWLLRGLLCLLLLLMLLLRSRRWSSLLLLRRLSLLGMLGLLLLLGLLLCLLLCLLGLYLLLSHVLLKRRELVHLMCWKSSWALKSGIALQLSHLLRTHAKVSCLPRTHPHTVELLRLSLQHLLLSHHCLTLLDQLRIIELRVCGELML